MRQHRSSRFDLCELFTARTVTEKLNRFVLWGAIFLFLRVIRRRVDFGASSRSKIFRSTAPPDNEHHHSPPPTPETTASNCAKAPKNDYANSTTTNRHGEIVDCVWTCRLDDDYREGNNISRLPRLVAKNTSEYKKTVIHRTDRTQAPFGKIQLSNAPIRFEAAEKTQAVRVLRIRRQII